MSDIKRRTGSHRSGKRNRSTMEDAAAPLYEESDRASALNKQLVKGIAASLVLHLICTVVLLGMPGGGGEPARQAVTYVDLNSVPAPKSAPIPVKEVAPQPLPEPAKAEPVPLPQAEPAPEVEAEKPQPAVEAAAVQQPQAEERSRTTFGLGLTKGYFKSLSDGDTLRPDVKVYYLDLLQGINEKWWLEQRDDQVRAIMVNLTVARNGEILGSTILQSSGNIVYDRAVQKSLEGAGPLPPLPDSYPGEFFQAPIRLVPPLNLMAW